MSDTSEPSAEATASPAPARAADIAPALLDGDALKVLRHLRRTGHKGYLVGGCVRDLLLGQRPKDFDVATSAHPEEVKKSFRNCRLIGRRFRLAHVYYRGGKVIEVSTFRSNPLDALADGAEVGQDLLIRHDNVFGTEEEDARRRDFTINGLFYDPEEGKVVDYVGGRADLEARLVRTIGNPDVRMREDPVRILRAIRFAAKCDLAIEPETLQAMKDHVAEIPRCAPPRVLEELLKLTRCGAAARCLTWMREVGVLKVLLPPIDAALTADPAAWERQLRALAELDKHVRKEPWPEIPSDAVLLSLLLQPLPRNGSQGPIARVAPAAAPAPSESNEAPPEGAEGAETPAADPNEIDPELEALDRRLSGDDDSAEDEDADDDSDEGEEEDASADAASDDAGDAPGAEASASEESASPRHALTPAEASAAVNAPLPSEALRSLTGLHDERLAASGIPTFTLGGQSTPWELPGGLVPPETVLSEMVRTARLPRRIAERARLILSVQALLAGERKRKRFSPAQFTRESIFPEALAVFELTVAATGKGVEQLAEWEALHAKHFNDPRPEASAPAQSSGDRPRRRRRGGRGRRGGGGRR